MSVNINGITANGVQISATAPAPVGEVIYTTNNKVSGSTTNDQFQWECPAGVTSVCVVAVGAGGNAGGGLGWKNNIAVVPGQFYTVQVGRAVPSQTGAPLYFTAGGSFFLDANTVRGQGGQSGSGGIYIGDGGGNGGASGNYANSQYAGGGAGGYSGNGGAGRSLGTTGSGNPGSGGGGGGGGRESHGYTGGGGGVGLFGQGANGAAGTSTHIGGYGGSGGADSGHSTTAPTNGGSYGGGRAINSPGNQYSAGGAGAVRIIWGAGRSFPNNAA